MLLSEFLLERVRVMSCRNIIRGSRDQYQDSKPNERAIRESVALGTTMETKKTI